MTLEEEEKDLKIMKRLKEHLEDALKSYPRDWFVICLQGSYNYNLDDEESDIDTKLLILPSFQDIVAGNAPYSKTHIMPNEEHVDIKDLRSYFKLFEKANINFVEILFTDYWICNPAYLDLWLTLREHREEIARMNPYNALSCMKGMASEKVHALCHEYPSRMYYIKKYGYDGKQLSHLMRIQDFVQAYTDKKPYEECVRYPKESLRAKEILNVKRHKSNLSKEEAISLSDEIFKELSTTVNLVRDFLPRESDPSAKAILDEVCVEILKRSIKEEILKGEKNE